MDHTAANALIDAVENACHEQITTAIDQCTDANAALRAAVSDAYNSGIPSHTVASWLNWSRATYYRYLNDNHITSTPIH